MQVKGFHQACFLLPSKMPNGCKASTWSQTTLKAAVIGIASRAPAKPQIQAQKMAESKTAIEFKSTLVSRIFGPMMFPSKVCTIKKKMTKAGRCQVGP